MSARFDLDQVEADHARFNARKTLSSLAASGFETERFGAITVHRDPNRSESYYNRLVGVTGEPTAALQNALDWVEEAGRPVRIDTTGPAASDALVGWLRSRGFEYDNTIMWLARLATTPPPVIDSGARELTVDDRPAILELLRSQQSVDASHWAKRQHLYCNRNFRWFGILDGHQLVSAASTWRHREGTVFGSAFTSPAFREQGLQRQLLHTRIGASTGRLLVDCSVGTTSHRNCQWAGFADHEARQVWSRPEPT